MGHWHADGTYHQSEHVHGPSGRSESARTRVKIVFSITVLYMLVEYAGGWWTNSLALMADATHMLTDSAAIGLTLISMAISKKGSSSTHTYGYQRAEILGAFVNGVFLAALAVGILWNAFVRFRNPEPVDAGPMIVVAGLGLLVNLVSGFLLLRDSHDNLALKGALIHVLGDALGSVGAIVAGLMIWWKGWIVADPAISLVVAILILYTSSGFIRETAHVILQGVPRGHSLKQIQDSLLGIRGVAKIHDLHLWVLTPGHLVLTVHVVKDGSGRHSEELLLECKQVLLKQFQISHSTIQLEKSDLEDGCC